MNLNYIYLHLKARDWLASRDVTGMTVNVADMAEVKGQFNLTSHFILYFTKRLVSSSGLKQDWLLLSLVCVLFGWISYLCGCSYLSVLAFLIDVIHIHPFIHSDIRKCVLCHACARSVSLRLC